MYTYILINRNFNLEKENIVPVTQKWCRRFTRKSMFFNEMEKSYAK